MPTPADSAPCPIPFTHDRLTEAHYFLHEMMRLYHDPFPFRYSLNAFIGATRTTTWMLQKESRHVEGFEKWYAPQQARLIADPVLNLIDEKRTYIVHKGALEVRSTVTAGYFKHGRPAGAMITDISPWVPSAAIIEHLRQTGDLHVVDPERVFIGEEYGVSRTWKLPDLPDRDLLELSVEAWEGVANVVAAAHQWRGAKFEPDAECKHDIPRARILLEHQVHPEIMKNW